MAIVVTYRLTSRLSMRIAKNGDVHVSAPVGIARKKVLAFINDHRDWIRKARERRQSQEAKRKAFFGQLPLENRLQRTEALTRIKAIVLPMVAHYAPLMQVTPNEIRFRAMISRWGVCDVKTHNITFSIYLLLLPEWCIEHTVVHELAHLIVPNHSMEFYAVMNRFFPRWKEARRETKRISKNS